MLNPVERHIQFSVVVPLILLILTRSESNDERFPNDARLSFPNR